VSGLTILLLLLASMMGCFSSKADSRESAAEFSAYLDRRIPGLSKRFGIPGVGIALVQNGGLVWSSAYGYADLEHKRTMTADAVCRMESISKSVTAWGVMRLVERELLELDAPIRGYLHSWRLPETQFDQREITIRRLLCGNAGLALGTIGESVEYAPQTRMPTLQAYLNGEVRLLREPGSGFMYSNAGFNLLELVIEEVTGSDFATYMAADVLEPLGMHHASFAWDSSFHASIPTGYEIDGTVVPPYVYPASASGGLFATVEDIAHFVCAEMTGDNLSDHGVLHVETIRLLHEPQVDIPGLFGFVAEHYGFGHFIETLSDGRKAVWHGGQGHGWMTHFHAIPASGDGIVILANSQRSWPFIAQVLTDWSQWLGVKPVKMGRITYATRALWGLITLVVLITLWQAYRLVAGLVNGTRWFAPLGRGSGIRTFLQLAFGWAVIVFLVWSAFQPYLLISSVFPRASIWAGFSFLALSAINVISACFPHRGIVEKH
jgi:CubicO group peptidase (beta-lactamase class C family)